MATLDAQTYPHILDAVLASSPRATLLGFRGTSLTLKIRADELLAHHIVVGAGMDDAPRHPAFFGLTLAEVLTAPPEPKPEVELQNGDGRKDGEGNVGSRDQQVGEAEKRNDGGNGQGAGSSSSKGTKRRRAPETSTPRVLRPRKSKSQYYVPMHPPREGLTSSHSHGTPSPESSTSSANPFRGHSIRLQRAQQAVSLFAHARILDFGLELRCPELWVALASPASLQAVFPRVLAVRLSSPRFPTADAGTVLPPAVWFRRLEPTPLRQAVHFRTDPVPTSRLVWSVSFHPYDTSLHHSEKGGIAWLEPFYTHDTTREFVFLFVPDQTRTLRRREGHRVVQPRSAGDIDWNDYRRVSGVLGVLEDVAFHMGPELERPHTIAGLEGMPPQMLGLEEGTSYERVVEAVRAGVKRMLVERRDNARDRVVHPDLWPDALVDDLVDKIQIVTLDEYREQVGEEQYAWETTLDLGQ